MNTEETYEEKRDREYTALKRDKLDPMAAKLRDVITFLGFEEVPPRDSDGMGRWLETVDLDAKKGDLFISFHAFGYQMRDRVSVSGRLPRLEGPAGGDASHYGIESPLITVSADKDAAQIVRDVERRFLPAYLAAVAQARERNAKASEHYDKRAENFKRVLGRKPGPRGKNGCAGEDETGEARIEGARLPEGFWGTVKVDDKDARLELHGVPVELAAKIVDLLRKGK